MESKTFIGLTSITMPPSHVEYPGVEWPPPRSATSALLAYLLGQ